MSFSSSKSNRQNGFCQPHHRSGATGRLSSCLKFHPPETTRRIYCVNHNPIDDREQATGRMGFVILIEQKQQADWVSVSFMTREQQAACILSAAYSNGESNRQCGFCQLPLIDQEHQQKKNELCQLHHRSEAAGRLGVVSSLAGSGLATGSTTLVSSLLDKKGHRQIGCSQPRRARATDVINICAHVSFCFRGFFVNAYE